MYNIKVFEDDDRNRNIRMTENSLFFPIKLDDRKFMMTSIYINAMCFWFCYRGRYILFFAKKDSDVDFSLAYINFLLEVTHIHVCKPDVMKEISPTFFCPSEYIFFMHTYFYASSYYSMNKSIIISCTFYVLPCTLWRMLT